MENIDDLMPLSTDWNKERLAQLKNLLPDIFTNEGKLDLNELQKIIDPQSIAETERYEFRWFGKSAAKRTAYSPSDASLVFDNDRSLDPENSKNIIIEGENLEVLKLLSTAYREKIKCIYIDPPYNTGKDFVYSDNFTEDKKAYWEDTSVTEKGLKIDTNVDSDGRYHSNWLNMMYSRLLISRQLLREDGVIFISIDDNEVHNLRKICDEVFGEENFGGQIVWQTATDNNPTQIAVEHEYVICYLKDITEQDFWEIPSDKGKVIQEKYNSLKLKFNDDFDAIQSELRKWIRTQTNGDDLSGVAHYSYVDEKGVFYPGNSANTKPGGYTFDILHPITKKVCSKPEYGYRWTSETFKDAQKRGDVQWGEDENTIPKIKKRLDTVSQKLKSFYYEDNRATSAELKGLFNGIKVFNNPKSVNFLKIIFRFVTNNNDFILDFFGGSGSSGQAVTELNKTDGGNRQYIIVQLPELTEPKSEPYKAGYKKISDITIARNKKVIARIQEERNNYLREISQLQTNINKLNEEIKEKKNGKQELPMQGVAEPKDIQQSRNKIAEQELKITDLAEKIAKIDQTDKGFKVFRLTKSNFPRVEWAPDPDKSEEENIQTFKKYIAEKEAQLTNLFNRAELLTEILIKKGYLLTYKFGKQPQFAKNEVLFVTDGEQETFICLDGTLEDETVEYFKTHTAQKFICLERALNSTKKYNLRHYMGDFFTAF